MTALGVLAIIVVWFWAEWGKGTEEEERERKYYDWY